MTFLVYCGEKTCAFNNNGKCKNFKIALNEQGVCMGYSPLVVPNINSISTTSMSTTDNKNNPIGFGG